MTGTRRTVGCRRRSAAARRPGRSSTIGLAAAGRRAPSGTSTCTIPAPTRGSCATAASAWASRTPTAGGTRDDLTAFLRIVPPATAPASTRRSTALHRAARARCSTPSPACRRADPAPRRPQRPRALRPRQRVVRARCSTRRWPTPARCSSAPACRSRRRRPPSSTASRRLLDLTPDDHVLEIGTGWGGFAVHAARRYGCRVTTTTISERQFDCAPATGRAQPGSADRVTVLGDRLPRAAGHLRQGDRDRDDRGRRLARLRPVLPHLPRPHPADDGCLVLQAIVIADESLRPGQAQHRLHQGGDLPRAAASRRSARSRRAAGAARGLRARPSRRHRRALPRDAAPLAGQPRRAARRARAVRPRRAVRPAVVVLLLLLRGGVRGALPDRRAGGVRRAGMAARRPRQPRPPHPPSGPITDPTNGCRPRAGTDTPGGR